jgi:hypothetical protein
MVSLCVLVLAAGAIALLQSFTVSDTRCNGTIQRLVRGGPFTNPDGVCAGRETVRFGWSVAIAGLGCLIAWLTLSKARRTARHR